MITTIILIQALVCEDTTEHQPPVSSIEPLVKVSIHCFLFYGVQYFSNH